MTDQPQFDRLRRNCSAQLKQFITEAHQNLSLPTGVQQFHQFTTQRHAEYDACHEYLLASSQLADFLQQQ